MRVRIGLVSEPFGLLGTSVMTGMRGVSCVDPSCLRMVELMFCFAYSCLDTAPLFPLREVLYAMGLL